MLCIDITYLTFACSLSAPFPNSCHSLILVYLCRVKDRGEDDTQRPTQDPSRLEIQFKAFRYFFQKAGIQPFFLQLPSLLPWWATRTASEFTTLKKQKIRFSGLPNTTQKAGAYVRLNLVFLNIFIASIYYPKILSSGGSG